MRDCHLMAWCVLMMLVFHECREMRAEVRAAAQPTNDRALTECLRALGEKKP